MMTTQKQLVANRANAKRSTGPKSEQGKARSRMNSWKHGLTARHIVIFGEDPKEFESLRAELWEEFKPRPGMASLQVDRLAADEWRLRRGPRLEAAIIEACCVKIAEEKAHEAARHAKWEAINATYHLSGDEQAEVEDAEAQDEEQYQPEDYVGEAVMKAQDDLAKLVRYEASLMASRNKTLQMCPSEKACPGIGWQARGRPYLSTAA
jgi:hypothetical protein